MSTAYLRKIVNVLFIESSLDSACQNKNVSSKQNVMIILKMLGTQFGDVAN